MKRKQSRLSLIHISSVEAAGTSGGVNGEAVQAEPTVYYYAEPDAYANSWQGKAPGTDEADGALKMLYSAGTDGSAWSDGWSTVKPQERNISAVGVNVTFGEKGLQPGDSYEVVLVMNAPEYTVCLLYTSFTITAGETNRTYLENPIGNKKMGRLFVDKVAKFAVSGTDSVLSLIHIFGDQIGR